MARLRLLRPRRWLASVVLVALFGAACSSSSDTAVTIDGVEIPKTEFDSLHADVAELDDDTRAGTMLLLILREAFTTRARTELGLEAAPDDVEAAYFAEIEPLEARGELTAVLAARNQTAARIRLTSLLDTLRDDVGAHLVRTESGTFDLELAVDDYLLETAEVCLRQIQLAGASDFDVVVSRIAAGEEFASVARELSIDPFVSRDEGVGAGGDLGCSAPNALPPGLDIATLDAPLNEVTGPVISSVGAHALLVYQRSAPDPDEAHDAIIESAVSRQRADVFRRWAIEVLTSIEVDVNDSYGRWGVLPETDPVPTVVPRYRIDEILDR